MENKKVLSIIIPCYGKTNDIVRKSINTAKDLQEKHPNEVEVIFAYKNTDKYNYDWVKNEYNFKKFIIAPETYLKTGKVDMAIKECNSEYTYIFDPDDFLLVDNFSKLISEIKDKNYDFVATKCIMDTNNGEKIKESSFFWFKKWRLGNYNSIYSTKILKSNIGKAPDILICDDQIRNILTFSKSNKIYFFNDVILRYMLFTNNTNYSTTLSANKHITDIIKSLEFINGYHVNKYTKKQLYFLINLPIFGLLIKSDIEVYEFKKLIKKSSPLRKIYYTIAIYSYSLFRAVFKR